MDKYKLKQLVLAHTKAKCRTIHADYERKQNPSPEAEEEYQELFLKQDVEWLNLLNFIHDEEE